MSQATRGNPGPVLATIAVSADGWFTAVSPQFLAMLGQPVEALAGVNLVDLVHPLQAPNVRQALADGPTTDEQSVETQLFLAGDVWTYVVLIVEPMENDRITVRLHRPVPAASDPGAPPASLPAAKPEPPADPTETAERPAFPGDAGGDFPYEDSDEHMAYVAMMPVDAVPDQRDAIRRSVGDDATPMIEIDTGGRTTFVRGAWHELSADGSHGADAFEEILNKSGQAEQILAAIDHVSETAEPSNHEIAVAGLPPRWVRVLPIPSPHVAGQVHALVAIVPESALRQATDVPVAAPTSGAGRIQSVSGKLAGPFGSASSAGADGEESPLATSVASAGSGPGGRAAAAMPTATATTVAPKQQRLAWLSGKTSAILAAAGASSPAARGSAAPVRAPRPEVELLTSSGRSTRVVWGVAAFFIYLAMQGLYLEPAFDWPSPLQGLLNSQACMIQPLCDNNVLGFNHLAVASLVVAVAAFAVLFGQAGPRRLVTDRPAVSAPLGPPSAKVDLRGPGLFIWLAVLALAIVTLQTVFTDSVSTTAWIAATTFGALAAWRSDRDNAVPLGSTIAALSVALSCLCIPLGIGAIWLGAHWISGVLVLLLGVALFAFSLWLLRASDSSFDRFDYSAMAGLSTLTAVLGLLRHRTWRYAFIGDEWSFFEGALDGRRGNAGLETFDIGGPNDYFTGLTFELQGSVMQLAGDDVWGWRLSALLPMVLSVAAMYTFTRWLSGRTAALAAAIALATGHMLLSFSMIGYNNSQSLVAVSASFAALAWAHQRPSALRFFLLGSAVGSTFLVYAMARLALLPIGLLFLVLFRDDIASFGRRLMWTSLGGLAMSAPALFSWRNWEALLKATPVQAEDPVLASGGVGRQVLENTLAGWLSFIGSTRNTHFIVGPHLDVISAVLLIVGIGYVIARSGSDKALRWFLIGGVGLWTLINAVQQYDTISNTRSFMIPLVYCVFIGIGTSALLPMILQRVPDTVSKRVAGLAAIGLLGVVLLGLNQWHIGSYANDRQQLTEQATLVQQFEQTASADGDGMTVYVGWPEERNARLTMVLRAHDVAAERMVIVPGNGSLNIAELCQRDEPVMLAMHQAHSQAIAWAEELAACWGTEPVTVTDPHGAPKLRRVTNQAGAAEFRLSQGQRFSQAAETADYSLADTIDIAVDGSGQAFALTRSDDRAAIHQLGTGRSFDLAQRQPIDFDITADGIFVVAANGGDDRVVWYDGQGGVIRRYPGREDMPMIGGLSVDSDGAGLWISDTARSRVLQLDADFKVVNVRSGQGVLDEPSALATGPDGWVWVFSAGTGQIVLIDDQDQPVTRISAQVFAPVDAPRLSSTNDGWLIRPVPERPVVELVDPSGQVIDARGGMNRPRAAALRSGQLVAADPRWHEVPVLGVDDRWQPDAAGVVSWGTRAVSVASEPLGSPFISDELLRPGPVSTNLAETELVQVSDAQTWRSIGAEILGEVHAVATTADGGFVADLNGRLIRLDAQGAASEVISVSGGGATFITDIEADQQGVVWVLDAGVGQVSRVSPDGSVTVLDTDPAPLRNARGAGVGIDGTLFVASTASAQLTEVAADGRIVGTIPVPGRQPSDVAQAADGTFWMIDAQDLELVHLTQDGELLSALALDAFSSVESPHIALDGDVLWVTEPELTAVFAVDTATGQPTGERIELARPDGARVAKPIGIAVSTTGQLWIPDSIAGAIIIVIP